MDAAINRGRSACIWVAVAIVVGAWSTARAENAPCLKCHEKTDGELYFDDDSALSLQVSEEGLSNSAHARLGCTDCHKGIEGYPHPDVETKSAREYQIARAETCKRCHYAYYTRALDGIHYAKLEQGQRTAPTCVDCHGAHETADPTEPRIGIDERCGRCHEKVATTFERSVHGKSLAGKGVNDAPVCTSCHGAHAIADPRRAEFRAASYTLCATCHGDAKRMERYGLSTAVLTSYLDDFHGVSNRLYSMGGGQPGKPMATCTDCHGMHDIQSLKANGEGAEAIRGRVLAVCQRCHAGAPPSFADAWLSHHEPTLASAPLVWGVRWTYRILIPLIMLGLVLHILLHLWRVRTHR